MRIRTHTCFSFGLSMLFLTYYKSSFETQLMLLLRVPSFPYDVIAMDIAVCGFFAWLINQFIDIAGHRITGPIVRRSWRTHHVLMAPFWGAVIPLTLVAVPSWVLGYGFPSEMTIVLWLMATGALIGLEHLLLDMFTPDGIYLGKSRNWNIARVNGGGAVVNYSLIGIGFAIAGFSVIHYGI